MLIVFSLKFLVIVKYPFFLVTSMIPVKIIMTTNRHHAIQEAYPILPYWKAFWKNEHGNGDCRIDRSSLGEDVRLVEQLEGGNNTDYQIKKMVGVEAAG